MQGKPRMASEGPDSPRHYLMGRNPVPSWLLSKPSEGFVYPGDKSIANGVASSLTIQIDNDAHFLVEAIQLISGLQTRSQDLADVQISDSVGGMPWSNVALPMRDLAGKGDCPKYLSHPNLIAPGATVTLAIQNLTGSDTQFYAALVGRKIANITPNEEAFLRKRLWFQHVISVATLAASSARTTASVQVQPDGSFLCYRLLSQELLTAVIGATAGTESAEVMMNLSQTGSGKKLFGKNLAARLVVGQLAGEVHNNAASWGNGQAFALRKPWYFPKSAVIEAEFDNRSTDAITNGFRLVLEGIKVFDK